MTNCTENKNAAAIFKSIMRKQEESRKTLIAAFRQNREILKSLIGKIPEELFASSGTGPYGTRFYANPVFINWLSDNGIDCVVNFAPVCGEDGFTRACETYFLSWKEGYPND